MNSMLDAAGETLRQISALLREIDDATYAEKIPAAFHASIGGHVRHALDHFRCLLDGLDAAEVNYDARARDPRIESERLVALAAAAEQFRAFALLDAASMDRPLRVRAEVSGADGESAVAQSTVGREIMFCVLHAVHHFALIGVMAGLLKIPLPAGFGVAPSTIRHERERLADSLQ